MKKCVIFAAIAEREVDFYLALAQHAQKMKWQIDIQFISFYQKANHKITVAGFKVWDIYSWSNKIENFEVKQEEIEKHFKIENLHKIILHEKLTFGIHDNDILYTKYFKFLNGIKLIFNEILKVHKNNELIVFQELGGFIAPLSLMYVCKNIQVQHIFFEPAFFKGTVNFVENSFISNFKGISRIDGAIEQGAVEYIKQVQNSKQLVIPQKDQHHYQDMGLKKIFNYSNFIKLYTKLISKYVRNEKQEYEHISNHVKRIFKQFYNRIKTDALYTSEIPKVQFVYFPFHVQLDVQLTIRNPDYLNQLAFVEFLVQILPAKYKLVVKEHPASIGGFNPHELKRILKANQNLVLLSPMMNTYDILAHTDAVITINSKVGAEAISLGKTVACMGHGFYWNSEVVSKFSSNVELIKWLEDLAIDNIKPSSHEDIMRYFSEIYRHSYRFELYNHSSENLSSFYNAINRYILNEKH